MIAHAALSLVRWDWDAAAADLQRLRALGLSNSETLNEEMLLFKYLGFPEQSLAAARASAKLDPLLPVAWANIASSLFELGRYEEASAAAGNGVALLPRQPDILLEPMHISAGSKTRRQLPDRSQRQATENTLTAACSKSHWSGEMPCRPRP